MVELGVLVKGTLPHPLKKLDDGSVVPDVSYEELHEFNQRNVLDQIELAVEAEQLGYEFVMHPENHFYLLAHNSPTPLQVQAAVAARTDRIRLVQMANILPWNDPLKLSERLGMLDVLSDGRVEVGIGTGDGPREYGLFRHYWQQPSGESDDAWQGFVEKFEIMREAWTTGAVSYDGDVHRIPPPDFEYRNDLELAYLEEVSDRDPGEFIREADAGSTVLEGVSVFPRPKQDPHPQFWKPISSVEAAEWAAEHGVNGCARCMDFEATSTLIDAYYAAAEDAGWPDHRETDDGEPFRFGWDADRRRGMAVQVPIFNTDVASEAAFERWKLGRECAQSFYRGRLPDDQAADFTVDAQAEIEDNDAPIVGDAAHVAAELETLIEVCGCRDIALVPIVDVIGLRYEDKLEQLAAFVDEVVPRLGTEPAGSPTR
ncbi:hypothetical protein BRC81_03725 [Halobacteriales archaeon QS_1_68_20]|nr:MAG: hypothetical protein BRC81_03725 [Halobacteriales archaeon QS_1_68_20]